MTLAIPVFNFSYNNKNKYLITVITIFNDSYNYNKYLITVFIIFNAFCNSDI